MGLPAIVFAPLTGGDSMISLKTARAVFRLYDRLKADSVGMKRADFVAHASRECAAFSKSHGECGVLFVALLQVLTGSGGVTDE